MNSKHSTIIVVAHLLVLLLLPHRVYAGSLGLVSGPLIDHPVHHPLEGRSGSVWRKQVGAWGENFAEQTLRLRGFNEIHEIKTGGNNGIDRIAVRRGTNGTIIDAKLVEVKASRAAKPKLGNTRYGGTQMSRRWLAANLSKMRHSGDDGLKKLALELSRFRKASGRPLESLGELIHVNTRSGRITGYSANGRLVKYSQSLERLLKQIQKHAVSSQGRTWATRVLSQSDQIRSANMSSWLGKSVSQQSRKAALASSGRRVVATQRAVLRQSRGAIATKILRRSAGRIAVVVALAFDAKELFDTEYAYRNGRISVRQRNVLHATTLGGMAGAGAGASAGGMAGAWLGLWGGPFAEITVPAGALAGAIIGGISGYFGGSAMAGYAATAWYNSIDASVRDKFELTWLAMDGPRL